MQQPGRLGMSLRKFVSTEWRTTPVQSWRVLSAETSEKAAPVHQQEKRSNIAEGVMRMNVDEWVEGYRAYILEEPHPGRGRRGRMLEFGHRVTERRH